MPDRPFPPDDPAFDLLQLLMRTIRAAARVYGIWAVGYGVLALYFGDALWGMSPAYDTARVAPWSPQSWGLVLIVTGGLILFGLGTRWQFVVAGCFLTALWCGTFAVLFLYDAFKRGEPFGITGFWVYAAFGTLMANGGLLRWKLAKF